MKDSEYLTLKSKASSLKKEILKFDNIERELKILMPTPPGRKKRVGRPTTKTKDKAREMKNQRKELVKDLLGDDLIEQLKTRHKTQKEERAKLEEQIGKKILWAPHPGPQTDFLACNDYEVLYCGGRASGKSDALLVCPLRFVTNPNFKGLMIRKTIKALSELISRAKRLYPDVYPGTIWKEQEKLIVFPSGATIEFGYYDHPDDYDRYHGREFCFLGVDEVSQYESRDYIDKLKSVVRSTDPNLPRWIRLTTNPSGPGRLWIKEYFIDLADNNTPIVTEVPLPSGIVAKIVRRYIKSTIFDNPTAVDNDPEYLAYLSSLPEIQKRQWLEGDFDAADGLAFEDFNREAHVVKPYPVSSNWIKFRAIDWGYRSKAVCLWFAVDGDNNIIIYREYVVSGVNPDIFARNVLALEQDEYISYGVVDGSIGRSEGGPTIEAEFIREGLINNFADKSKGSRIHGKMLIHKYLRIDPLTKRPRLFIFNTCKQLIKELSSLQMDSRNSEDVNTLMEDHAYDALRYGLSSRPDLSNINPFRNSSNHRELVLDSKFGY